MNSDKKTARSIGVLFIISTSTFLLGDELIGSVIFTPEYLENAFPNKSQIALGAILQMINDFAVVGIGILFYSVLKRYNRNIALAYTSSRIIEGVLLLVSSISLLSIIPLSEEYLKVTTTDISYFYTLGKLLKTGRFIAFQLAMINLSLGSLFLCYLLYRRKLIPRSLSILGFIGYALLLTKMLSEIFGYRGLGEILYLPVALCEILIPLWLIVKGFNSTPNPLEKLKPFKNY